MVGCKLVPLIALVNGQDEFLGRHLHSNGHGGADHYHLAPPGASECDYGNPVSKNSCKKRVQYLADQQNATMEPREWVLKGSGGSCLEAVWGQVPGGCSVEFKSDGTWTGRYKSGTPTEAGCVSQSYQLVCAGGRPVDPPFSCDMEQAVGVGEALLPKWGWRSDWGVCTKFFWGGAKAGSNANQFATEKKCNNAARKCPYTRLPGCLGVPPTPVNNQCNSADGSIINKGPRAVGGCQRCTCQDGQLQCNAVPRYRKEIVDMTQPEFDKFAEGINILKVSGDWVEIAWMHQSVSGDSNSPMVSHGNNRFLHWHRKYLFDLESLIQAAVNSCEVTIPYWNWALDPGMAGTEQMKVWGPDRYGALKYHDSTSGPASPQTWKIFAPLFCPEQPAGVPSESCCFAPTCGTPSGQCGPEGCPVFTTDCCVRGTNGEPQSDECFCETANTTASRWDGVIVLGRNPMGPRNDAVTDGKFGAGSAFDEDPIIRAWSGDPITTVSFATMQTDLELRATSGPMSGSNKDVATDFVINETQRDAIRIQQQEILDNFNWSSGEQPQLPQLIQYAGTTGFVEMLENFFHNSVHCAVGGIMCGPLSPYDPIFFLHHAQVDKIWKDWQDQHLDVESEREWARNESWAQMAIHICPQTAHNGLVNAADVEDSMDMTGLAQDGSVYYYQRQQDFQCGDDEEYPEQWKAIQTCMKAITNASKWHEIQRVVAGPDDVSDMCSANNPSNFKASKMWLEAMAEAGHMTGGEKKFQLNLMKAMFQRSDLEHVSGFGDRETKYEDYTQLTRCEQKLCMAVTSGGKSIRSVCKDLQQQGPNGHECNDEDLKERIKCRTKHWTWNKINPENVLCD